MIKLDPNHPAHDRIVEIENWFMDGLITKDEAIQRIIQIVNQSR